MTPQLSFKIQKVTVRQEIGDSAGNWQYVGAEAVEQASGEAVQLLAMKRDNSSNGVTFPASMLTATLVFASRDNDVSDSLTIQGLHDLTSDNETGSVTSASRRFAEYIGGQFSFDGAAHILSVSPRELHNGRLAELSRDAAPLNATF